MTFNPFGYTIPQEQAHQIRAEWFASHPNQIFQQPVVQPPQPIQSPLQLGQIPVILAPYQRTYRQPNLLARAVVGAIVGAIVGKWVGNRMQQRRARKAQEMREVRQRLGVPQ